MVPRKIDRLSCKLDQEGGHLIERYAVVHSIVHQGVLRHVRVQGVGRILHDGDAAARLDCPQARGSII